MQILPKSSLRFIVGARTLTLSSIKSDAVGPPHPISNLRPVLYDEEPQTTRRNSPEKDKPVAADLARWHPYALDEFDGNIQDIQWKIERQRLDSFNHNFWADSNARFEKEKQAILSALPESTSAEMREAALSELYRQWLVEGRNRQMTYTQEWNRRNFSNIMLAARHYRQRMNWSFNNILQMVARYFKM